MAYFPSPDSGGNCCECDREDVCDDCDCPALVDLLCDSVSASKTKCGFTSSWQTIPKFFQNETVSCNSDYEFSDPCGGSTADDVVASESKTFEGSYTGTYNLSTCISTITNGEFDLDDHKIYCSGRHQDTHFDGVFSPSSPCFPSSGTFTSVITKTDSSYEDVRTYSDGTVITSTIDLADEYTTSTLKSNVVSALPSYSGTCGCGGSHATGQDCLCSAVANLSTDESSYTLRRFKFKITFDGPACEGMATKWQARFIPTLTGTVVYSGTTYHAGDSDPDPAHWTYTDQSWIAGGGETETDVQTQNEPPTNGTIDIVNAYNDCSGC